MFDEHALRVLEYPKVLDVLARYAHWAPGQEGLLELRPLGAGTLLERRQQQIQEAWKLLDMGGVPLPGGLADVRPLLQQATMGQVLTGIDLLAIRDFAVHLRAVNRYFSERLSTAPWLGEQAQDVRPQTRLESDIHQCLGTDGRVLDHATPRLAHLRTQIRQLEARIQDSLQRMVRQPDLTRMLQESLVTTRQGRWVVPVRASHRGTFPGLVIDQSSSGSTLFMEPLSLVGPGNELRAAMLSEEQEVTAILSRLSGVVAFVGADLHRAVEILAAMDVIFGLAVYGRDVRGVLPAIGGKDLRLESARHPLLLLQPNLDVVPISFAMDDGQRTIVVTGPNTGGKTVAIKTVGLLIALALSGVPIPADRSSRCPAITNVFADIGDEQGIAQNLSTFSSHLTQVLQMLPLAQSGTLVLLDEVGAGTDPSEGSALGKALLSTLHDRGCWTIITTHLSDLKTFAEKTPGMMNASVEFDIDTLRPTYRLVMGKAGQSNALQIAARLGLPDEVLRRARGFLGEGSEVVSRLLLDLEDERDSTRRRDAALRQARSDIESEREALVRVRDQAQAERAGRLEVVLADGRQRVQLVRQELHELLRHTRQSLEEAQEQRVAQLAEAKRLVWELTDRLARDVGDPDFLTGLSEAVDERLRAALTALTDRLWHQEAEPEPVAEAAEADAIDEESRVVLRTAEARLTELQRVLDELLPAPSRTVDAPGELVPGKLVYVHSFGQEGTVVRASSGRVDVQVGSMRLRVRPDELELLP